MLLYHYSQTALASLTTKRHREKLTTEELLKGIDIARFRSEPGPYYDHISFFFEPIPCDIIGNIFKPFNHPFWKNGNKIYQHVIESDTIGKFLYNIVETPLDINFIKHKWTDDMAFNNRRKEQFFKERGKLKRLRKEHGSGNVDFERVASGFVGTTRDAFIKSPKINDPEDMLKYAASVPHVMLYPDSGVILLTVEPQPIVIGKPIPSVESHLVTILKW